MIRPGSKPALLYALAAGRQNRLWHLAGRFIARQDDLERVATPTGVRVLARGIPGLDVDRLLRDARSASVRREAARTLAEAQRLGIPGTPSFAVRIDGGPLRPALPRGVGAAAMAELADAALVAGSLYAASREPVWLRSSGPDGGASPRCGRGSPSGCHRSR